MHNNANQISMEDFEKVMFLRDISESCIWTDRMLATLVKGVKRGKWYSLMDKVLSRANIEVSTNKVLKNGGAPGIDSITVERYASNREHYTEKLIEELRCNVYNPKPVKRIYIVKTGSREKRPLGIPAVKDRIVQRALLNVVEPIFEKDFSDCSYGFRPKRSCKDALKEVDYLIKNGFSYVLDADIKGYFDSISHEKVLKLIEKKITDSRILELIKKFLRQDVMKLTLNIDKTITVDMNSVGASFDFLGYSFLNSKNRIQTSTLEKEPEKIQR